MGDARGTKKAEAAMSQLGCAWNAEITNSTRMLYNAPMPEKYIDWIDEYFEWPVSPDIVALKENCNKRTVQKWARANGVRTIGGGKRMQYLIFREDVLKFRMRERPGRRWPK